MWGNDGPGRRMMAVLVVEYTWSAAFKAVVAVTIKLTNFINFCGLPYKIMLYVATFIEHGFSLPLRHAIIAQLSEKL